MSFLPEQNWLDITVFAVYLISVSFLGAYVARRKTGSDDFFLAGRNLPWWIIGGSLIAANISTHHFIGMAGQGFALGLAIASYEWLAAIMLIVYGKFFLPYYLKSRITTMSEFLEHRFNKRTRLLFAIICLVGYVFIELAVVLYTGSLAIQATFGLPLGYGLIILCLVAGGYTFYGGLRSVAYTDMIQVSVLILGGLTVTMLGLMKVSAVVPGYDAGIIGGFQAIMDRAPEKFHMVLSWNHPDLPWVGVFFGGLWLANIFYWGCNQFITQKTLAARNIWHGQMGVVFAGYLKLLVPVLVVLPGIIAWMLYDPQTGYLRTEVAIDRVDLAFPALVHHLLPAGFSGLVMAGLMGAVMSTIASLLTASSTVFTFDIYQQYINPRATSEQLVRLGRAAILTVLLVATVFGYFLQNIEAIFTYIQKYWSIATPAISAAFLAGFFYKRATATGCFIVLLAGPVWATAVTVLESTGWIPPLAFLNRAGIDFVVCCWVIWLFRNREPIVPAQARVDWKYSDEAVAELRQIPWYARFSLWSGLLIIITVSLYIRFF